MRRVIHSLIVGASLVVGTANAEVRIVRAVGGDPRLDVRPTAAGIWTPRGPLDPRVVNPNGDQWGDGLPASAVKHGHLFGAWVRPASGDVVLLRAQTPNDVTLTTVSAPDASGTPVVWPAGENYLVAWTNLVAEPSVSITVATADNDGDPAVLLPGQLVGVVQVGDVIHVLSHRASAGELQVATFVALHYPVPVPVPITVAIIDLRLASHLPQPFPIPIPASLGMHLPQPIPISTTTWAPCIDVRADDALVAWAARDHQVGSILLDELGVVDAATFVRGPAGSCTAVLNAASRERN